MIENCTVSEAVEKQIPKRPADICRIGDDYIWVEDEIWIDDCVWTGNCPVCGEFVSSQMNYCDTCGQAINWNGGNEKCEK